jgi:hypothetical protein
MHLLSFVPPPGLVHLPTQLAARSSHRIAFSSALAGEWRKAMPMKPARKKR